MLHRDRERDGAVTCGSCRRVLPYDLRETARQFPRWQSAIRACVLKISAPEIKRLLGLRLEDARESCGDSPSPAAVGAARRRNSGMSGIPSALSPWSLAERVLRLVSEPSFELVHLAFKRDIFASQPGHLGLKGVDFTV